MKEITNKFYIVKGELIANIWTNVHTEDILRCIQEEKNLYVVDVHQHWVSSTYSYFELEAYKNLDAEQFPITYLTYEMEIELVLPQVLQMLLTRFHHNWVNLLFDYLISSDFEQFMKEIPVDAAPDYISRWNMFLCNPYRLKGVILSRYSYPAPFNNGLAFSTFEKTKPKTFLAIENCLKKNKPFSWYMNQDLVYLQSSILLWNYEFVHGVPPNEKFFRAIFDVLKQRSLHWLILGSDLFYLKEELESVLIDQHPLELLRKKQEYDTDAFLKFEQLTNIQF